MPLPTGNVILSLCVCLLLNAAYSDAICTNDTCEYTFVIRKGRSMTYSTGSRAYDVELNGTDLQVVENSFRKKIDDDFIGSFVSADDVITADGYRRDLITINGEFHGPTIEVMQGAEVVVHVENNLVLEGLTIHWHGLQVAGTPWMDGAAYVTQCPILPHNHFTYRFEAEPFGTHWYHSHFHTQRMDGLFGLLIIHARPPTLPIFEVTLIDWIHTDTDALAIQDPSSTPPGTGDVQTHPSDQDFSLDNRGLSFIIFKSILINGRGRFNETQPHPLEEFLVTPGQTYRFHLMNAGHSSAFEVSIDNHQLTIVETETSEFVPIPIDSVIIHAAESYVIEVEASQATGKFWFRARSMRLGKGERPVADGIEQEGLAIITYETDPPAPVGDPTTVRAVCSEAEPCQIFNCPFKIYPDGDWKTCIPLDSARSINVPREEYGLDTDDDEVVEIFLNVAFPVGPSINGRKYISPRVAMIQSNFEDYIVPCNDEVCDSSGCACTHILDIPINRTIQLVLTGYNLGSDTILPHPMHLHGHSFAVLKMGYPEQDPITGYGTTDNPDVACFNPNVCSHMNWTAGRPELNKVDPPVKDSILVPTRGYVVVRFRSNNPGYWLMHCHIDAHAAQGMVLILNEGPGLHPTPPVGFPTCGDFELTQEDYRAYRYNKGVRSGDTSTRPADPVQPVPTQMCAPEGGGDKIRGTEGSNENEVTMDFKWAVGVGVGLVILGAALTLLPAIIFNCWKPGKVNKVGHM